MCKANQKSKIMLIMSHFLKIRNLLEFSVVFCQYTIVTFAKMHKINEFWIDQSLVYLEPFLFYQSSNFWQFRGNFCKKMTSKKFFQKKKIFFSNFWKSHFLSIIWRDLNKKIFSKFQKKFVENLSN